MIGGDNPISATGDRNPRERYLPIGRRQIAGAETPSMPARIAPALMSGPACRLSLEMVVLCGVLARHERHPHGVARSRR